MVQIGERRKLDGLHRNDGGRAGSGRSKTGWRPVNVSGRVHDASRSQVSRAELAYRSILDAIVKLELTPGQVISTNTLSQTLGVSRTPVREALKRLEALGFVRSVPQSGTVVAGIDPESLRESTEMREVLEVWSVRRVAQAGLGAPELRGLIEAQRNAGEAGDADGYLQADQAFHDQLARLAGNAKLVEFLNILNPTLMRARYWALRFAPIRVKESTSEHIAIADAIDSADPDKAGELMRSHIWSTFTTLKESIERQSTFWT